MADDHIQVTVRDGVASVELNRPRQLNALTWTMVQDLHHELERIGRDPALRVVILTGSGRGFCAGLDIERESPLGVAGPMEDAYDNQEMVGALSSRLRDIPQPVIAAINGPTAGGGLGLALACDVRLCTPTAHFNVAFIRVGLSGCDVGVSYFLPRLVGPGLAAELMLTGRRVEAPEALRIGLVNHVVGNDELMERARALARDIARNTPFGVRMTKQVLRRNLDASLEDALELENRTQILSTRSAHSHEALAAFIEGRDPGFAPFT